MENETGNLLSPYGGELVNLLVPEEELSDMRGYADTLPSICISERSACDLELMAVGAFSPLKHFMSKDDFQCVVHNMRLANNYVFPIPITLQIEPSPFIQYDKDVAIRDVKNNLLAILTIEEIFNWDISDVAYNVYGTESTDHPLLAEMQSWGKLAISGRLRVLQLPQHYDFKDLRLTPAQVRHKLKTLGKNNVVAFQTRNPLHKVHEELTRRAIQQVNGVLLLHPAVGMTNPGDIDHYTRVRTYKAFTQFHSNSDRILLSLVSLAMRMAGPREALWHAIIRRNYGANYFIVGRDHASPKADSTGNPFYTPYAAQELVQQFQSEIGVKVLPFPELVYLPDEDRYEEISRIPAHTRYLSISGTQVRDNYLKNGETIPEWFTRPEIANILVKSYPPKYHQGVCIWFTGLSGAGKSTTAEILVNLLNEYGRLVTLLDGDVVRTTLSKELGFSKQDRDINIRRIGFVANEVVRHGGVVIVAAVSPYREIRNEIRHSIGSERFIEVYVDTPLEVCEQRDAKGMYAKARRGEITGFTGIDDPYESPLTPEITIETISSTPEENARLILNHLIDDGIIFSPSHIEKNKD